MKHRSIFRFLAALSASAALASLATAQTATDPNEGSRLSYDRASETATFSWWGRDAITYFIQHSEDLLTWDYLPVIELTPPGTAGIIAYGFSSSEEKVFLRLKSSDIPTADPETADFDGDGVSNTQELANHTDPLQNVDSELNGLPDDWERFYFGSLGVDPTADADGDGVTNLAEFTAHTSPTDPAPALAVIAPTGVALVP